jgi:TolA-binding protein
MPGALIGALLFFGGCGGDYPAEKAYWHYARQYAAVLAHPAAADVKSFAGAVQGLRDIIARYQAWPRAVELQITLAHFFAVRGDRDAAEQELRKVLVTFPEYREQCAQAQFMIATLAEQRGDMLAAAAAAASVMETYPATLAGLQAPVYIIDLYKRNGMKSDAAVAAAKALRQYDNLIAMNPYGVVVPQALEYMSAVYVNQQRPADALQALKAFAGKYPKSPAAVPALLAQVRIQSDILKSYDTAAMICTQIIRDYPAHAVTRSLYITAGDLYVRCRQFDTARRTYAAAAERYPKDSVLQAAVQMAVAASYDSAGDGERARLEYSAVVNRYPLSAQALQVPLVLASHYRQAGDTENMQKTLDAALVQYRLIITNTARQPRAADALELTASVYMIQKKHAEAIAALAEFRRRFPADMRAAGILLKTGVIYEEALNDAVNARACYQEFLQRYPSHALAGTARERLHQLLRAENQSI